MLLSECGTKFCALAILQRARHPSKLLFFSCSWLCSQSSLATFSTRGEPVLLPDCSCALHHFRNRRHEMRSMFSRGLIGQQLLLIQNPFVKSPTRELVMHVIASFLTPAPSITINTLATSRPFRPLSIFIRVAFLFSAFPLCLSLRATGASAQRVPFRILLSTSIIKRVTHRRPPLSGPGFESP